MMVILALDDIKLINLADIPPRNISRYFLYRIFVLLFRDA